MPGLFSLGAAGVPTTTNKGYEVQTTGSNSGTWGDTLNDDVISVIDNNVGGITTKTLSSSNVTLSASESQTAILRLAGTITTNIQVTTSCIGFFFVENLTSGSFTVTITNGSGDTYAVPQGTRATLISDSTNGVRPAGDSVLESGTVALFVQTSAPTGWTKSSSHDNKALRVVTGTASSGGSTAFTSVFTSRTIAQANLPNVTFTGTSGSGGAHSHTVTAAAGGTWSGGQGLATDANGSSRTAAVTSTESAHTHSLSVSSGGSGTALDFAVQYVDVIIATRD